jgi:hypothetical protein
VAAVAGTVQAGCANRAHSQATHDVFQQIEDFPAPVRCAPILL